jgi:hypothetical protein
MAATTAELAIHARTQLPSRCLRWISCIVGVIVYVFLGLGLKRWYGSPNLHHTLGDGLRDWLY